MSGRLNRKLPHLFLAAQTRDAAAISRLPAVCQADARRKARRHCHVSDVDDAVQESLLTISRKFNAPKAAAAFLSRLFVVIKRAYRSLEQRMVKHEPLYEGVAEQLLASRTDEALRLKLANALEPLPAHYLEVVLLRGFEELTIAEIAERLQEQPGAIKSRLHRARELVREDLVSSNG